MSGVDPDLQAVWDAQDEGVETLDSVWSRTAARLEAGGTGSKEAPYVLNQDNRFSDISNPFEEGMRLFEEGQIADAALCFEAEIARNPENSQVSANAAVRLFSGWLLRRCLPPSCISRIASPSKNHGIFISRAVFAHTLTRVTLLRSINLYFFACM